jgi:hypothetical protein
MYHLAKGEPTATDSRQTHSQGSASSAFGPAPATASTCFAHSEKARNLHVRVLRAYHLLHEARAWRAFRARQLCAMDAIGNFLLLDSTDAELGDYLDAGGKHAYHYRPFTDSAVAGAGSSPWRPQVRSYRCAARRAPPPDVLPPPSSLPQVTVSGLRPSVQWPHKVLQRVQVLQSGYRMGLLPEVHRAWAALPSSGGATRGLSLVFWDYEGSLGGESCPLFSEPGCGQVLTLPLSGGEGWAGQVCSLSLVVPKADSIGRTADGTLVRYILVLALPDEVQLFTVAFEGDSVHGGMQVFGYKGERVGCFRSGSSGAPLASLSTDGVRFDSVAGTQHGRIFLGGSDGCVHELVLAGAAAAGGVRRGLAGGISVAVGEVVAGAATYVKRRALSALALGGRVDPSLSASLINHGVGMLHTLLSAVLGSTPVAGYPIVDLAINHERGIMAALSLDGRLALWNVGPAGDECVPVAVVADLDAAALDFCATGDASNKPRSELFTRGQGRSRLEKEGLVPGPALPGLATLLELPSLRMPPAVWPAVSVAFLPSSDSARVHLVVTAASGARLYFTTLSAERYKELGRGGAPPEVAGALPSPSAAPGLGLSLVYIRLPPPFTTVASYRMGEAAALPSARPDGFEPVPSPVGLVPRGGVAVSGRHALMGLQGGAGGGAETDAERDARPGSVLVCSRDYLRRREAGTGGEADREAAGWCRLPYAESVCSVEVNGCPLAIAAEQADPSLAWDPVFTPVGAMCLPEGETAPLPPRAWEVRCGLGLEAGLSGPPPHTASVASLAETRAGNKRPRPDDASELSLAPLAGSIVAQEGLTEGGVPLAAGQLVRRRLWDAAPGWGTAGTLFSTQLEARASAATWLVLTVRGVTRLSHVRPIDQASAMLCKLDLTASALSGPGPSPTLAMHDPALDALLGWMPLPEEAFALIAAIACGVLTPALQGVSPVPTLATRPCTAHILHLADGADKAGRAAGEVLKLYKTPAWDPSSRTHSKHDLRFSPAVAGLLLYSARLLRPVWDRTLFIAPPATTDTRMGGAGLVRVGAKRVAGAREGGGVAPGVPVAAGVLLPRFTAAECVLLSRRLAAVAATLRSLHPSWVESFREGVPPAMAASVRELGLEAEFGLEEEGRGGVALGGGLGESRAEPSAKELVRRAWSLEGLYVALTWRLVSKAREGADFMAAVADPAFGGASVLWAAGGAAEGINIKGKPVPAPSTAVPAQAGAVSDAELRTLAKATRWVDLLSLSSGAALADALANRMIAVLRARAEAEGSAGKGAAVGTPARAAPAPRSTPLSFSALSESSIGGGPRLSASLIGGGTARAGAGDEADALARHLQERCPSFFSVGNRLKVAAASAAEAAARTSNAGQRAELLRESAENARGAVRSWGSGASGPTSLVANLGSVQALAERWTALGAPAAACAVLADVAEGIAGGRAGIAVLPEDAPPALSASLTPSTEARMRSYTAIVGVLAGVMAAGGEGWRGLLNDVLTRPDALLHDTVYRWLERAPAGPGSVLPRTVLLSLTTSEYLPLYLTRRSEGPELLVQFYEARGEYGRE